MPIYEWYDLKVENNVFIPMRDGVKLAATIVRPLEPRKYPALLSRSCYNKERDYNWEVMAKLARHDYAAIVQDVRGRWLSEGDQKEFATKEAEDGYDTIEWIASQPWCNGKVGMWGSSFMSFSAFNAAKADPPSLKCIYVGNMSKRISGNPTDVYTIINSVLWHYTHIAGAEGKHKDFRKQKTTEFDTRARAKEYFDIDRQKWLWYVPLIDIPDEVFGNLAQKFERSLKESWFETVFSVPNGKEIGIPAYHYGGWYDNLNGDFLEFREIVKEGKTELAKKNQKLTVGPWTHGDPWYFKHSKLGDIDFGPEVVPGVWESVGAWFDYWLKGTDTGIMKNPPVKVFTMGENKWNYYNEWPPAEAVPTEFYIHSKGKANTVSGDGALDTNLPEKEPLDSFVYDPKNPVMTISYVYNPWYPYYRRGPSGPYDAPFDQRPNDHRSDILMYKSEPLEKDLRVTGMPTAKIWASSTAKDTDFVIRLNDVHPDGFVHFVSKGILRASRCVEGRTVSNPSPIEPRKSYEYNLEMKVTSILFKKGHTIRVDITSSDFPAFDRNHNTGRMDWWADPALVEATQEIFHDAKHPSKIILPVIKK